MEVVLRCATRSSPPIPLSGRDGNSGAASCGCREALSLRAACPASAGAVSRSSPDSRGRNAHGAGTNGRKGGAPVGEVLRGDRGCGLRRPDPLCRRDVDYGEVWRTLSNGHVRHQRHWGFPHRSTHDRLDRAIPTAPELAALPGRWSARRLHHLFKLRIRNLPGCANRRPLARSGLYGWKRLAGIPWGLDRGAPGRPALERSIGNNGAGEGNVE
jgi:hypothetical protein